MTVHDPSDPAVHDTRTLPDPGAATTPAPTIGRIVVYRAKTRGYAIPAIVSATAETLDPLGVELGHVPGISDPRRVHLHVLTPGAQVVYQEFDVPEGDGPGSWSWPVRVPTPGA